MTAWPHGSSLQAYLWSCTGMFQHQTTGHFSAPTCKIHHCLTPSHDQMRWFQSHHGTWSTIRYFKITIQGHWNDLHSNVWAATHHFASGLGMPLAWTSNAVDSDSYTSLSSISVPIIWGTAEKINKPTKIFFTHSTMILIQTIYTKYNIMLTFLSTSLKRNISLWQQHSSAWLFSVW